MRTLFQWLLRLFTGALLLGAVFVAFVYYVANRSIPDYDGEYLVDGVTGDVEIVRDNANVPHILGPTAEDVYFGLGFAHAQDRLWQMTMMRRTAQGRLSELFGERTLSIDMLLRRFDLYTLAAQSLSVQDPQTVAALNAYAKGVNAWVKTINDEALGRGAPEFFLFSPEIAHWTAVDSLAVVKLMGLQLSGHLSEEVLRARTSLVVGEDGVKDLLPDDPNDSIAALPDYATLFPNVPTTMQFAEARKHDPLNPAPRHGFAGASNAWAAAPSRSAAGGTLLANDPHLGFAAPAIWYLARLELPTGGVIGGTIPGMPVILVGRGQDVGWAITSSYLDDQDLFIERLNPDNTDEYLTPDGYKPFETRQTIINVKDAAPRTITLRWTENGPVIPGDHYDIASITPRGHVASLGWTVLSGKDTSLMAGIRLMQSKTVDQAIDAMSLFVAPSQNLMVVDRDQIAMKVIGAQPRRAARHQTRGRMPSPGWIAENRWQGVFDYAQAPETRNPSSGIIGNTNNKMIDRPFPRHISHSWGDTQRIHRWKGLMQGREVHTRDSFIEAQLDTVSYSARSLLPLIAADLWFTGEAAADGTPAAQRQRALELLASWNGEMNEHLPEPLIYAAWLRRLQDKLIRDDLGPLADEFTHVEPVFLERVFRDIGGAGRWCDVVKSAAKETCSDMARIALDEAILWIEQNHGSNLEALHWGDAHQATHDHPVLGSIPLLKFLVNIRQSTSGGDNTLMRGLTIGEDPAPFRNVHGAGYRGVYDFADTNSSVFITSTGQSGHPLSRHYDDYGELWRRGEYIPMTLDLGLARAAAVGITWLRPN